MKLCIALTVRKQSQEKLSMQRVIKVHYHNRTLANEVDMRVMIVLIVMTPMHKSKGKAYNRDCYDIL